MLYDRVEDCGDIDISCAPGLVIVIVVIIRRGDRRDGICHFACLIRDSRILRVNEGGFDEISENDSRSLGGDGHIDIRSHVLENIFHAGSNEYVTPGSPWVHKCEEAKKSSMEDFRTLIER